MSLFHVIIILLIFQKLEIHSLYNKVSRLEFHQKANIIKQYIKMILQKHLKSM